MITEIASDSAAELVGLQVGDVIEEVNRQAVRSVADFDNSVTEVDRQSALLLLVRREDRSLFFALSRQE